MIWSAAVILHVTGHVNISRNLFLVFTFFVIFSEWKPQNIQLPI